MQREVLINVTAPIECTEEQFQEWVEYELGALGGISLDNPLHEYDIEVDKIDIY